MAGPVQGAKVGWQQGPSSQPQVSPALETLSKVPGWPQCYLFLGEAGLAHGTLITQPRWTGFNLPLPAVPGLWEPDASPPARPGKGRGPSAPGSQQITLLGLELPPAMLASLAGALQRGHGLRRGDSPTRAPAQPLPPRQRC